MLPHEEVVVVLRQHPVRLLPALAMAAGGLLAAAAVNTVAQGVPWARLVVWVLAGFLVLRAILDVLGWSTQFIVLTSWRLILSSGFGGSKAASIPLLAVQDLAFARSGAGRLGYGAFTFQANGRARAVIDYIPYPERLYLEIYGRLYPADGAGDHGDADPWARNPDGQRRAWWFRWQARRAGRPRAR